MNFAEEIKRSLLSVLEDLGIPVSEREIVLEHPAEESFGDYSTNIAMLVSSKFPERISSKFNGAGAVQSEKLGDPRKLAQEITSKWQETGLPDFVEKIEVAGPGFLNIWLNFEALSKQLTAMLTQGDKYGYSSSLAGRKILLEHTSPNPQTTIMLGHLRNNFLGMSVGKILEFCGAKVVLDDVVNDRGVHLCRSMFGYLTFGAKKGGLSKEELLDFRSVSEEKIKSFGQPAGWKETLKEWMQNPKGWWKPEELRLKPDHANLIWYVLGSSAYKLLPEVEKQVEEILLAWEKEEEGVRKLWQQILEWSDKGYAETYRRIGSRHDQVWRESEHWKLGKAIVEEGLEKKVFRKSEGAIVTDLERYGLPDNVVVKSDGTALYITQDLALTKLKKEKFPSDLYIWDIGAEQTLYFKQLFSVIEQLGIEKKEKLFHLSYSLINFKGGEKMSTRKGNVIMADEILDELKSRTKEVIKTTNQELRDNFSGEELSQIAEKVAIGAIKYSLLKYSRETTIFFDFGESLAMQGNSGPYLLYTYARTQSVLGKVQGFRGSEVQGKFAPLHLCTFAPEEIMILRTIYKFPEVIVGAAKTYSPNLICNFLFDLAQKFNLFYDKHRILANSAQLTANSKQQTADGLWSKAESGKQKAESNKQLVDSSVSEEQSNFRLLLTSAVGQVLKNGLTLLGIETLERM